MNFLGLVALCLITIFIPPLGVFFITGCNADLLVNIFLTCLGFIPGHFHAFYIIFVYYYRSEQRRKGIPLSLEAPLIFSDKVNSGGYGRPHFSNSYDSNTQQPFYAPPFRNPNDYDARQRDRFYSGEK